MKIATTFRRYHRQLAIIMCLPLTLTVITGVAYPIADQWLSLHQVAGVLLQIHSGSLFGMETTYPLLNGLGLIGLLVTGLSMTNPFRKRATN